MTEAQAQTPSGAEIPPSFLFSKNLLAYFKTKSEIENLTKVKNKINQKKLEALNFEERFKILDRKMKEFSILHGELMQNHSLLYILKNVIPKMAEVAKNWQQDDIVRIERNNVIEKMISSIENSNNKLESTSYVMALDEEYLSSKQEERLKKAQRKHGIY